MPKSARRPKNPKRDSEQSKQRLIEAAIEVFSKRGFKATTTRMIAKRAGLNAALIARYFGGKRQLLMAVVEVHSKHLVQPSDAAELDPSNLDSFLAYSLARIREVAQQARFLKILLSQAMVDNTFREKIWQGILPKRNADLAVQINRAKAARYLPASTNASALANGIIAYLEGQAVVNLLILGKPEAKLRRETIAFFQEIKKLVGPTRR